MAQANPAITTIESAERAKKLIDSVGTKGAQWWMSFLILCGMSVTVVLFYWHRQDQQAMKESYETVVKSNTEALLRVNMTLERIERKQ